MKCLNQFLLLDVFVLQKFACKDTLGYLLHFDHTSILTVIDLR